MRTTIKVIKAERRKAEREERRGREAEAEEERVGDKGDEAEGTQEGEKGKETNFEMVLLTLKVVMVRRNLMLEVMRSLGLLTLDF